MHFEFFRFIQTILERLIKTSIYLLVFLLPLFWLPFSFEPFEFNKQYLLFFLVSIAFFAWLTRMVLIDKEIRWKRKPLDIFILAFLFIAILSAVFSVDKGSSVFGFYGRFSDGLIGLLSLGVLYFLITNNVGTDETTGKSQEGQRSLIINHRSLVKLFIWSVFLVVLISYFSIFGLWQRLIGSIGQIGLVMGQPTFNPAADSMEGLAIFISIIIVLIVGLLGQQIKFQIGQLVYWLILIFGLGLLIIIDFARAWFVLLVSLSIFLVLVIANRMFKENVNQLLLPLFLIIIATVFLFLNLSWQANLRLSKEPVLGQGISWLVALGSVSENIKAFFLGSGIGTFYYDFAKFKPAKFNLNPLWQLRFDRPGCHLAEILGTMGFLGLLSYLTLIGLFLLVSWFILAPAPGIGRSLLMAFLALLVAQLVFYQNSISAFTFWLILGLGAVSWRSNSKSWWWREISFSLRKIPELSLIATAFLTVIGLAIFGSYYFGQQFYRADILYAKSQRMVSTKERIPSIEKVVKLNPNFSQYQIILAREYLNQVQNEIRKPVEEQDSLALQSDIARAIEVARRSANQNPSQVAAVETLAMVYRDIRLVVGGASDWAIKSFEKAISLEPSNPVLRTELGKLYLEKGEREKAKEQFSRARELKSDYLEASLQEALIFERENNLEEAVKKIENLAKDFPFNSEVLFQLGRLYFNTGRLDEAISQFKTIVNFFPDHSNALYSLGVAYQKKGQKEEAISYFEKVLELNPDNQNVIQKLEELRK